MAKPFFFHIVYFCIISLRSKAMRKTVRKLLFWKFDCLIKIMLLHCSLSIKKIEPKKVYFNIKHFTTVHTLIQLSPIFPFLYPLKTSENLWFSDIFKGYRNEIFG